MKFSVKLPPQPPRGLLLKSLNQLCRIIVPILFAAATTAYSQSVKIGLLIQDSSNTSAIHGAELAVRMANEKGGLNGRPFRLVTRTMEGPWGTGSKQAVDLIFNEKVWALLGSHDGRNAHLVEQAATKSAVVFVSAWSSDPTLAQAFVPWFFNCVPNDNQQAVALTEEIYYKRKYNSVAIISDNEYDSKMSVIALLRDIKQKSKDDPLHFQYEDYRNDINGLIKTIRDRNPECIILFCNPVISRKIFSKIKEGKTGITVYGSFYMLNEAMLTINELQQYDNLLLIPSYIWSGQTAREFSGKYEDTWGELPGMVASYSFDGMNVLINAIRIADVPDREKIQEALKKNKFTGVTGIISFDDMGNREGKPFVTQLMNGVPIPEIK